MSETNEEETLEDPHLPSKRKLCPESLQDPKKIKLPDPFPPNSQSTLQPSNNDIIDHSNIHNEPEADDHDKNDPNETETEAEDEDDDDENEEGDEEEAIIKGGSNGNAPVDKGKGIMKEEDYKGKGKHKVVEEDGSSSDEDDDNNLNGDDGDDDSDFSDDPLAEVDLNNILSSRTRRRAPQPGIYLVNDLVEDEDEDDDDDDDDEDDDNDNNDDDDDE